MGDKPREENKPQTPRRKDKKSHSKSLTFALPEPSNQRDSPSTSNTSPKGSFTGKKPLESQGSFTGKKPLETQGSFTGKKRVETQGSFTGKKPLESQSSFTGKKRVDIQGSFTGKKRVETQGSFTGKKGLEIQSVGDGVAEKPDIKEPKTQKLLKDSTKTSQDNVKSTKDLTPPAETSKTNVSRTGNTMPLDVERICLGGDLSSLGSEMSELIFSDSLIREITEKQKVLVIDDNSKRSVIPLGLTSDEKFEKCSKSMLRNVKRKTRKIIIEKYNCHKQWRKMKTEIKELKRKEEEQKVWILKYLDSPLSEEDDLFTKRGLLDTYYHILQTCLITIIAMSMMNSEMYYFSNQTVSLFFDEITLSNDSIQIEGITNFGNKQNKTLRNSRTLHDFWDFAETSLLNLLYSDFFNPYIDPITHTAEDDVNQIYANQVLGVARIRQVRVKNDSCKIHPEMRRFFRSCYAYYSIFTESTAPISHDMRNSTTPTAWEFTNRSEQKSSYYCGEISCYGGGGYYIDLHEHKYLSAVMLKELRENDWLSEATRAVFIDFTIYNANVNLFCVCKIVVEMPPTGGILTTPDFNAVKLTRYLSIRDFFILGVEFLYLLLIIYLTFWEVFKIIRQKSFYFLNPWNYLQMIILLLSYVCAGLNIFRYYCFKLVVNDTEFRYFKYMNFDFLKDVQLYFNSIIAIIVFASWVRLFSFFKFTTNMVRFQRTLARSLVNMLMFIPMFLTMIIAFSILAYLLFGHQVKEYSSVWMAFLTLIQAFLGEFNCTRILETNRFLGPLFYILFVFFVFFVLVNVFIAIISEAYASVMSVAYADTPEYGNYLRRGFVNAFTCCRPRVKSKNLNASLRKKFLFEEIQKALKRAGFRDKEIKIFFQKYQINYMNFLDEDTKSKISSDLNLKEFEINETSEQFQIDILKRKYDNLRNRLELLDTKLQPIIDKVDIIVHRL